MIVWPDGVLVCMQVEGVRFYADQALYKEPHGGYTPWHCDAFYWPLATDKAVTAWIPLQVCPSALRMSHCRSRQLACTFLCTHADQNLPLVMLLDMTCCHVNQPAVKDYVAVNIVCVYICFF